MATKNSRWSREELLVAFNLYCQMPFGKMHSRNPDIIRLAEAIGRTPSSVSMKLVNFASLDPSITSTGRKGLGNASRADKAIWDEFNGDWEGLAVESATHLSDLVKKKPSVQTKPKSEPFIFDDENYEGLTKSVQIQARIKQAFFRKAILSSYGGRCCITQISEPRLLVASHIVPWKVDPKNRLNPRNGLCLSALHDKAFDRGLITIDDKFCIDISPSLGKFEKEKFIYKNLIAIRGQKIALPEKFRPDIKFLQWHREFWGVAE